MLNAEDDGFEPLFDEGEWVGDYEAALQVAAEGGTVDWGAMGEPNA